MESVLAQDFQDFELIVVDDGSHDNTREVVAAFTDARIRYMYQPNAGLSAARNAGIAQAKGKYIAFLDDDDFLLPPSLSVRLDVFKSDPVIGWVSGGYDAVNSTGEVLKRSRPWSCDADLSLQRWLYECPACPSAVMVRRAWLETVGGFDVKQGLQEDWDLWLRLAYAGCPMAWVPEVVCQYMIHDTNMTRSSSAAHAPNGPLRVFDKFFSQENLPEEIAMQRGASYANIFLLLAAIAFRCQDVELALQDVAQAMQLDPALCENYGEPVLEYLLGQARNPPIEDPMAYARFVLASLPAQKFRIKQRKRKALGKVAAGIFFSAAVLEDWSTVRAVFPKIVMYDPMWLENVGVWSLMRKALLQWLLI
jgi:hypothetical protein